MRVWCELSAISYMDSIQYTAISSPSWGNVNINFSPRNASRYLTASDAISVGCVEWPSSNVMSVTVVLLVWIELLTLYMINHKVV